MTRFERMTRFSVSAVPATAVAAWMAAAAAAAEPPDGDDH